MTSRLDDLPAGAQAFIRQELAAGNEVLQILRPPPDVNASVYVMLARPCQTAAPGLQAPGVSFGTLAPGLPAVVVLGAQAQASDPPPDPSPPAPPRRPGVPDAPDVPPLQRFVRSMNLDYAAWREGDSYDLDAIDAATPTQRSLMLDRLLDSGLRDWRDIEAITRIGGRRVRRALRRTWRDGTAAQRMAMLRHAPDKVTERQRVAALVEALATTVLYHGLSECLDEVADCHPPEVLHALWAALDRPEAEVTVHCAAMLAHLHGLADTPFDWAQRGFFLRFGSDDLSVRLAAQYVLKQRILAHGHSPRPPM